MGGHRRASVRRGRRCCTLTRTPQRDRNKELSDYLSEARRTTHLHRRFRLASVGEGSGCRPDRVGGQEIRGWQGRMGGKVLLNRSRGRIRSRDSLLRCYLRPATHELYCYTNCLIVRGEPSQGVPRTCSIGGLRWVDRHRCAPRPRWCRACGRRPGNTARPLRFRAAGDLGRGKREAHGREDHGQLGQGAVERAGAPHEVFLWDRQPDVGQVVEELVDHFLREQPPEGAGG